jgi:hypothetical protein
VNKLPSSPGQLKKGEALLTIYSPDLLATERTPEMQRTSGSSTGLWVLASLKLWNVSDEDIDQL